MPKLLIVDDEGSFRQVLKVIFEAEGYQIATAENGFSALEQLKTDRIDLIISGACARKKMGNRARPSDKRFQPHENRRVGRRVKGRKVVGLRIVVGRLTRSLPLTRSNELPVDVARVPAAPFCETPGVCVDCFGNNQGFFASLRMTSNVRPLAGSPVSFPPSDESEKRMRSSAVKLLVRRRLRSHEPHHRQKLCEELRTEMPPGVPEEIFRRRRQTTNRGAFQVQIEFINDDQCLGSFPALLNDPKLVAEVEQHCSHHSDVEFSERRRQIVGIAVVHFGFGLQSDVT